MKKTKVLAIVPARGGSKGIKNKNLADLGGIPLLCYTIAAIKNSKLVDNFIISTDSKEILELGLTFGAIDIGLRPSEISQDNSRTFDALKFSLKQFEEEYSSCEYLLELQPTYPFRREGQIDAGVLGLIGGGWDSFTTVRPIMDTGHPDFIGKLGEDGSLVFAGSPNKFRRQDLSPRYACVGSVMGAKVSHINNHGNELLHGICGPVILNSSFDYFDINEIDDIVLANKIIECDLVKKSWYVENLRN